jgi:hypothetical protein
MAVCMSGWLPARTLGNVASYEKTIFDIENNAQL